ncbi:MAG: MoaD/ThiS family protein [Reyranella sp.]
MEITVRTWGNLRRFLPGGVDTATVQVPDGATIDDLTAQLALEHEVWAVAVNGEVASFSTTLSPGDHVFLFDNLHGG